MSLHDHLVAYAIDQYRVSGELYVLKCLRMWKDEYGAVAAQRVKTALERKFNVSLPAL